MESTDNTWQQSTDNMYICNMHGSRSNTFLNVQDSRVKNMYNCTLCMAVESRKYTIYYALQQSLTYTFLMAAESRIYTLCTAAETNICIFNCSRESRIHTLCMSAESRIYT